MQTLRLHREFCAADHPELIRKLVLHSTAHTLGKTGKEVQQPSTVPMGGMGDE